jgi:hypothetical protein
VIVAVIAMRKVQPAVNDVIDMVAMRYGFMPAFWAVLVRATGFRRTTHRILGADRN